MVPDDYEVGDFSTWSAIEIGRMIVLGLERFEGIPIELKESWVAMVIAAWMRDSVLGAMKRINEFGGNPDEIDLRGLWG